MSTLGVYELIVLDLLPTIRNGPWDVLDLFGLEQALVGGITDQRGFKLGYPAVNDWLRSLSPEDRDELIERVNHACGPGQDHDLAPAAG